jgi:lysophospholipase L1-like esterase
MRTANRAALAALVLVSMLAMTAGAEAKAPKRFYVSLGDSLSVGVQPNSAGKNVNTHRGYPRQLAKLVGNLKLVEYGCGFATSKSFIFGKRPCAPARNPGYKNTSARTSQLATAEKFLKRHRGKVAFVTIDIGANDVASCSKNGAIDLKCVNDGIAAIKKYGPKIAKGLRKAGGKKLPMAVSTLYDPFLQQWFSGAFGQAIAKGSVDLARKQVNPAIVNAFKPQGFKVAKTDVDFSTYVPFSRTTTYAGQAGVPVAVAEICRLTFMCRPKPVGPNIHANAKGYAVMAKAFRKALGKAAR